MTPFSAHTHPAALTAMRERLAPSGGDVVILYYTPREASYDMQFEIARAPIDASKIMLRLLSFPPRTTLSIHTLESLSAPAPFALRVVR